MATTTLHNRSEVTLFRSVRWSKAVQAGLIVAAVLILLTRGIPWLGSGAIDPAIMGREINPGRQPEALFTFMVLAAHMGAGVVYALIIAPIVNGFRPIIAGIVGGVIGLILYLLSYVLFSTFSDLPPAQGELSAILTHLAFGVIAAETYKGLARSGTKVWTTE